LTCFPPPLGFRNQMTQDKAREYFSAYYDDSLDRGLKQGFEQKLKADPQLSSEYRSFERVMLELGRMQDEVIEVPMYLSDRIATRMEQARVAEQKSSIWLVFKRYGFAAVAAVAIVGAGVGLFLHGGKDHEASGVPGIDSDLGSSVNWPSETISIAPKAGGAHLEYTSATAKLVEVRDANGKVLKSYPVDPKVTLRADLTNPNDAATVFELKVSDSGPDELLAVPGTARSDGDALTGSVQDFGLALANHFGVPVIMNLKGSAQTLNWSLDGRNPREVATRVLEGSGYDVSLSSTGVLTISGN